MGILDNEQRMVAGCVVDIGGLVGGWWLGVGLGRWAGGRVSGWGEGGSGSEGDW